MIQITFSDLLTGIVTDKSNPPLVLPIAAPSTNGGFGTGGSISNQLKLHHYVRMDVLPTELQERIKTAVSALSSF